MSQAPDNPLDNRDERAVSDSAGAADDGARAAADGRTFEEWIDLGGEG